MERALETARAPQWLAQQLQVTIDQVNSKMLQTLFYAVDAADSYRLKPSSD